MTMLTTIVSVNPYVKDMYDVDVFVDGEPIDHITIPESELYDVAEFAEASYETWIA